MNNYTRKELINLGISDYQAIKLTKTLQPTAKKGRANAYSAKDLIVELDALIATPRTRRATRDALRALRARINPTRKSMAEVAERAAQFTGKQKQKAYRLQAEEALVNAIGVDQYYVLEPI